MDEDIDITGCFKIDENGRIIALPMKLPNMVKPTFVKRPYIPIQPLVLAEDLEGPSKKFKVSDPASKKSVFKNPVKETRRRLSFRQSGKVTQNKTVTKKRPVSNAAGLMSLNVVEEEGLRSFSKVTTPLRGLKPINENLFTPTSDESNKEFENFERQCASTKKRMSPITSVCNLLENTNITGENSNSKIFRLVQELQQLHIDRKKQLESLEENQKLANDKFEQLLKLLENEENPSRRSPRLRQNSPVLSEKVDLRKNTLNRNFSMKLQTTPKKSQIANMYNTLRKTNKVLCTPKLNAEKFSNKVHDQCLLLSETPIVQD